MNFGFDRPMLAAVAFIIIPLAAFIFSKFKNPFVAAIPLGAPGGVPFKAPQMSALVKLLRTLEFLGILLLFLSAAGPTINSPETVWLNRGADIIFTLDVSPSMAALDMDGKSRIAVAKTLLADFAERRPSDNIGLTALGSDAALLVPPTSDRDAFNLRLESLQVGEFGDGTALGMGLAIAAYNLERSNARRRVVVLITDGENNAGAIHPETAASMLREMGVSLWVIGIGSAGEVPIDYVDPFTRVRRTGIYDSRFDTESLRRLSLAGGGTYIFAPTADAFAAAFSQLDDGEMTVQISRIINRRRSCFFHFVIPAIVMLAIVRISRRLLGAII
jgi:Ca-activated chloride channel family protein